LRASETAYALPLAVALALLTPACAGPGKGEAIALTDAVDRFLHASGSATAAQVQAVAAVNCTDERVCSAKQVCMGAIDPTAKSLALKDEVSLRLADIEAHRLAADSPEAQALPGKLDDASRLLREGHDKMEVCETKLADLQVAFRF
jgi:hypothetical protein